MMPDHGGAHDPGLVGRIVAGGLRVIERAGSTPQGPLYEAEYPDGRSVLLLVLPSQVPGQEPSAARFFRLATRIRHPNVAAVRAVGELEDRSGYYVVLEQLDGEPLLELLTEQSVLPLGQALDLSVQAAAGLEAVHQAGFLHGNVSPQSILVTRAPYGNPQVKLVGFSMDPDRERAMTLEPASVAYASPERLGGHLPDVRCDVFSLGAVLHHLLTGVPPAGSDAAREVRRIVRPILEKALAPAAAARYQTMSELRDALEEAAAAAASPGTAVARRALLGAAAGGLILVASGLLLVPAWRSVDSSPSPPVTPESSAIRAATPPPTRSSARADSQPGPIAGVVSGHSTTAGTRAAGPRARPAAPGRAAVEASRRRVEERAEEPEALGYVGDRTSPPVSADTAEAGRPPAPQRPRPVPAAGPKADPPRPRAVLEQDQGLRLAIGDVLRVGLAENVVEVRPGLLAVHLAAGGMGVPSAEYNLQRLYLAYSAATRQLPAVALELRRNGEPVGSFGPEGFRSARSAAGRR